MPEVMAVHVTMGEPEADVMRMVRTFTCDILLEWVLAGHVRAIRTHQRIEAWDVPVGPEFRKELTVDVNIDIEAVLSHGNTSTQPVGDQKKG